MDLIDSQDKKLEALKSLNSTIVTSRLYPPDAPQVTAAVDRGYKALKQNLRQYGAVTFFLREGVPYISGKAIGQEVIDSFPNLVVFRQLKTLALPQLSIGPEMDRFAFGQLLSVFNASVQKIKDQGGGVVYVTGLGLANYFPEEIVVDSTSEVKKESKTEAQSFERRTVKVRPALIMCLLGRDQRPAVIAELEEKMAVPDNAISIISSAIALILNEIQKKKTPLALPLFPRMLRKAEALIRKDHSSGIISGLAQTIVATLNDATFSVLLCQEYPPGFGTRLYEEQLSQVSQDRLANLFSVLRERVRKSRHQ